MKTSKKGIELIKKFEGLHDGNLSKIGLQPKLCPANIWTEGYGRAMRDSKGKFIKGIKNEKLANTRISIKTELEAEQALANDLNVYETIVATKLKVHLKQNQFDALVSHTYNTGGSNTLFELINKQAGDAEIKNWFETTYIIAGGRFLDGLIERRKAESKLYFL